MVKRVIGIKKVLVFLGIFIFTLCTANFMTITPVMAAGSYYVDAVNGNDNNTGTSTSTAWKTLSKINSKTFGAGDKILFKSGGVWDGQCHPMGSGTAASSIKVDIYGGTAKAVINGGGTVSASFLLENQEYWEIKNLELTNNSSVADVYRAGLDVQGKNAGRTLNHIYVSDLYVHDVKGYSSGHEAGGISIGDASTISGKATPFNDVKVENCTISNCSRLGIVIKSLCVNRGSVTWGTNNYAPHTNIAIRNNVLTNIGGDGIIVFASTSPVIEYNVVNGAGQTATDPAIALWVHNSSNALIQYNECYNTQALVGNTDGQGFDLDIQTENSTVQYNYSHDNKGGFIGLYQDGISANGTKNNTIRYNISQNDGKKIFLQAGPVYNNSYYNNTVFVGSRNNADICQFWSWNGYSDSTYFKNNIFYKVGSGGYQFSSSTNNVFEYNCFFGYHPASEPTDMHKITSDPGLVSPGSGGVGRALDSSYKLLSTSPCKDTGVAIAGSGNNDYGGNTVPYNNGVDMGAYEYNGQPDPAPVPGPNLLANSSFDDDISQNPGAWITWSVGDFDADYSEVGGCNLSSANHLTHWKGNAYKVLTYQFLTGLPNGLYTLKAWVKCDYGGLGTAVLEAKDCGGSYNIAIPTTSVWTQVVIPNINVTNSQCSINLWSDSPAGTWYLVDDVEFYKQ